MIVEICTNYSMGNSDRIFRCKISYLPAIMMVMRRAHRYVLLGLLFIALAAFSWQVGHSQGTSSAYFSETRHFVDGEFLAYYRSTPNPALVYGYPLTEAFVNEDGILVQYFQRARFEMLPNGQVGLSPVGTALYETGRPPANYDANPATCRTFDTGFSVCMDFLTFFDQHGGLSQFGQPISRAELDGKRVVQYFEYARLEWYPETNDPGLEVQLGPLGWLYFHHEGENQALLKSPTALSVIDVTSLRVHAFPAATRTQQGEPLSIFVIVQDQALAAVENASVRITVTQQDGTTYSYTLMTNPHGFSEFPLPAGNPAGKYTVEVRASYAGLDRDTRTSFRVSP